MAKVKPTGNELSAAPPGELSVSEMPDFLRPADGAGTTMVGMETAGQYIRPPRVKVIQKAALPPYSDLFHTGDVVVVDGSGEMNRIAEINKNAAGKPGDLGAPLYATPVFFYPEWAKCNPMSLRGKEPFIIERSLDPASRLAALAQNPKTWFEPLPGATGPLDPKNAIRNIEILNFVVYFHGLAGFEDRLVCIPYAKGGHRAGTAFIEKLNKRKTSHMCGNVFELKSTYQPDKGKGDWYNLECYQPSENAPFKPFIADPVLFQRLCDEHAKLKEAHKRRLIVVDLEDDQTTGDNVLDTYAEGSERKPAEY